MDCNIECISESSCINMRVDEIQSQSVNIQCNGSKSCEDITVVCPPYDPLTATPNCKITGISHRNFSRFDTFLRNMF